MKSMLHLCVLSVSESGLSDVQVYYLFQRVDYLMYMHIISFREWII